MNLKSIITNVSSVNNKKGLAYNQKKLINEVSKKVLKNQITVSEASRYLIEKLDIKNIAFARDGHIFVKIDDHNSEFLWCVDDFEILNPIKEDTILYGKIKLSSKERELVCTVAFMYFKQEITIIEAKKYLLDKLEIKAVSFSSNGKVWIKIDEHNFDTVEYDMKLTQKSNINSTNYEFVKKNN